MIRTKEIRKSFGTLEVLKGIDLLVERGEVVSIVGPSGAGKTTLLQILGSLSRPSSGEIEIDGEAVHALSDRQLSRFRNTKIGFVFQFHHLLPEFTALENVCIPGYIGGRDRREVEKRAAELLDGVGAWRVHGGGFAGGVQALMPRDAFPAYRKGMEALFGPGSCRELHITGAK